MKISLLSLLFVFAISLQAQETKAYSTVQGTDSFSISLSSAESEFAGKKVSLLLSKLNAKKTKILKANIKGEIKLKDNDSLYSIYINDYFEGYLIGYLEPFVETEDSINYLAPIGFKRINYSEIEWISTTGRKLTVFQKVAGVLISLQGLQFVIMPIVSSMPFYFVPLGIPMIYLGTKLFNGVAHKTYFMNEWEYQLKVKEP